METGSEEEKQNEQKTNLETLRCALCMYIVYIREHVIVWTNQMWLSPEL